MSVTALFDQLARLGVDTFLITPKDLTSAVRPRRCDACDQLVEVRVSTGIRWVCLDCAVRLSRERETAA